MNPAEYRETELELFAKEILADLDAVSAKIEKFERWPFESEDTMRAHANVPRVFLISAVFVVEQTPRLQAMQKLDPAEGRETLEYLPAFAAVRDRLEGLTRRVQLNLKSRKARLARQALQIFALLRSLTRDGHDPQLAAYVDILARDLGYRGRPRKARSE